jgi:chemotaxis protein CheY-P-specific phosphatase CheC
MTLKRDSLEQLAQSCAQRAGAVLATLLDLRLVPAVPWLEATAAGELAQRLSDDAPLAAVLAELEGASVGRIALLVSEPAARKAIGGLVERRCRPRVPDGGTDLLAASALLEIGNIAFSAAANALADVVGGRVFPSVPRFSSAPAAELAAAWPRESEALIAHFELVGQGDTLHLRLVWLPDLTSLE